MMIARASGSTTTEKIESSMSGGEP
jgi:hypothetical protein